MKTMLLAAAAVAALGAGSAFADGDVAAQPAQVPHAAQMQDGTYTRNGIYISNSPHREVWVYGAMRGPGYTQGGDN
jgi:hypothetical protein